MCHPVSEAGIVILPPPHNMDEEEGEENVDVLDLEPAPVMWSRKQGISHSDFFDPEDSLYDSPPDGFNLNVSLLLNLQLSSYFVVVKL